MDIDNIMKLLRKCEVFGELSDKELKSIAKLCKIEKFNDEDICQGYKKIDINIANKISVEGKVMRYREGLDEKPTPVIGAKIYMGGRANTTNDSGWYLLRDVPRNEKKYYLNLVSGTWNNGTIIPPLEEELRDNINTIRNIYVP